ncbi:MAG TPA: hypothetical protein VHB21_13565, partial [Minicystis sp.]|nr:hypothetical protein [Minicystis sp.]
AHLTAGVEYTLAWPTGTAGAAVRLFCAVPLALAFATLREIERGEATLVAGRAPAVSRALVAAVFAEASRAARDDAALDALFARCRAGTVLAPAS